MPARAIILCNGEPPSSKLTRRIVKSSDLLVAADGGANVARRLGLRPDVIIGDLDSITRTTKRFFSSSLIIRVRRQDNTDLEKALDLLIARNIKDVVILGATGMRLDFTLANLSVLWRYSTKMNIELAGDGWRAFPVDGLLQMRARRGTTVSLIPFGRCSGITLKGLRYSLHDAIMKVGEVGVSNVVARSPFSVRVKKGKILVLLMDKLAK